VAAFFLKGQLGWVNQGDGIRHGLATKGIKMDKVLVKA
jgi:hypothetical protein